MSSVIKHLRIVGKVQGVFFRESMRQQALQLHITGWVRNRRDGTVEATLEGSLEAVEALINWAHSGPDLAQVTQVEVIEAKGHYQQFEIKETV